MTRRTLLFAVLVAAIWLAQSFYDASVQPDQASTAAVHALTGGAADANNLRLEQAAHNAFPTLAFSLTALVGLLCFTPLRRRAR